MCYRPSVCRLSVTFVRPTQRVDIFGNFSSPFGTLAILDIHGKFHGGRFRGTPPSGGLNATGVAASIVGSRQDYCNSLLCGVSQANIGRLQRVQNVLARSSCCAGTVDH